MFYRTVSWRKDEVKIIFNGKNFVFASTFLCHKTFFSFITDVTYKFARECVLGEPLQPSPLFVTNIKNLPNVTECIYTCEWKTRVFVFEKHLEATQILQIYAVAYLLGPSLGKSVSSYQWQTLAYLSKEKIDFLWRFKRTWSLNRQLMIAKNKTLKEFNLHLLELCRIASVINV